MRKEHQLTQEEQTILEEFVEREGLPDQSFHLVGGATKRQLTRKRTARGFRWSGEERREKVSLTKIPR